MPDERRVGVIFDVDGTLLDTNYLHVAAWWEAFRERGHEVSCADIHRSLGMGSAELVERVLGGPDPSVSPAHSRHYAPYLGRMRPLPGAMRRCLDGCQRSRGSGPRRAAGQGRPGLGPHHRG